MGPVSHQRGKQVVDQVRGRTVHPLPYRIGGHVRSRGQPRGGAGQGPADLVQGQGEAFPAREQNVVEKADWFTGEEMIEKGPVELRRSGGTRELGKSGGGDSRRPASWPSIQSGGLQRPGRRTSDLALPSSWP